MVTRTEKAILALAGFAVLFVVLCPLTATPTAVVKAQQNQFLALAVLTFVLAAPSMGRFLHAPVSGLGPARTGQDLIELTCTRLC